MHDNGRSVKGISHSQRRRLSGPTQAIIEKARLARKSLQRVTDQVSTRYAEVLDLDAAGQPVAERRRLTEEERVERLRFALTWLQRAEEETRQLRALIERAIERELRTL